MTAPYPSVLGVSGIVAHFNALNELKDAHTYIFPDTPTSNAQCLDNIESQEPAVSIGSTRLDNTLPLHCSRVLNLPSEHVPMHDEHGTLLNILILLHMSDLEDPSIIPPDQTHVYRCSAIVSTVFPLTECAIPSALTAQGIITTEMGR
jgi:hypothetical protein